MTAHEYLSQLQDLDTMINIDLEELERLQSMIESIKSPSYSAIQGKVSGGNTSGTERLVLKLVDLSEKIEQETDQYIDLKSEICSMIRAVPCIQYRIILQQYYVRYKTLNEIAERIGKSYRWIVEMKKMALNEIQKILDRNGSH